MPEEGGGETGQETGTANESSSREAPGKPVRSQEQQPGRLKSLITKIGDIFREEESGQTEAGAGSRTRYVKQKIYSLQSISHEYTRLGEVESRVNDMITSGDRIIVSTHAGLYEIADGTMRPIRPGWYVEGIFPGRNPYRIHVVTDETAFTLELREDEWQTVTHYSFIDEEIYSISEEDDSTVWLGCDHLAFRIRYLNDTVTDVNSFVFHEEFYDPVTVRNIKDTIFFFLSGDIYFHDSDSLIRTGYPENGLLSQLYLSGSAITWIKSGKRWYSMKNQSNYEENSDLFLNLFSDINDLFLDPDGNVWVLHENQQMHIIRGAILSGYHPDFKICLRSVSDENGYHDLSDPEFGYYDRSLVFNYSAPFYLKESSTTYQYFIEGMSERWSEWAEVNDLSFPVLPMGRFTLHVRARNVLDQVTGTHSTPIVVRPPFWLRWWFICLVSMALVVTVIFLIRWRVRKLRRVNQILEEKVRVRTAEIRRQKDEIEEQKQEIMDSIQYAQRIQKAVLPPDHIVQDTLPEHFILYLPRDVVSGDFYWVARRDDKIIFTAADCTGHGVPGAFMSMLGVSFLNEIVNKTRSLSSGKILEQLRSHVKGTLSQSREGGPKDGMDMALCILDKQKMNLQYSGAFNPLYLIRDNELTEYKANRMPIGIHFVEETGFTNHNIKIKQGDCIYIFSDGFQDQVGGEKGKKFLSRSLKALLTEVHTQPMEKQKQIIQDILDQWMKGYDQVDDILLLGVRI